MAGVAALKKNGDKQNSMTKFQDFYKSVPDSPAVKRNKKNALLGDSLFGMSAY